MLGFGLVLSVAYIIKRVECNACCTMLYIHRVQEKKEASCFSTISFAFLDRFS